ncbi:MAG: peptidylprolyl isomerase [Candidatus Dojkabacteria bacterium]|nr:MAG: peptidylprolyl isomerase [Candidatus Dojkabacteria bacterium]
MKVDAKGVFKDNQKLFLSMGAVVILSMLIASATSQNVFNFWDLNGSATGPLNPVGNNNNGGNNSGDLPEPVSNGKNNAYNNPPPTVINRGSDYSARISTNMGSIELDLYQDEAPEAVNNFVFLAQENFYDGTSFHRVIEGFIIQGGDPKGDGTGGPGYELSLESDPTLKFEPFVIAMSEGSGANDAHGSQFFITSREFDSNTLDGKYTIFGFVTGGFTIVDKIESQTVYQGNSEYRPLNPIIINDIEIVEN